MKKQIRFTGIALLLLGLMLWAVATVSAQTITAPSGLRGTEATDNSLSLRWFDNANNETHYRLERSDDDGINWSILANLPANTITYVDTSFVCDTLYRYRVTAYIDSSNTFSTPSNANFVPGIPCAPSNLQVIAQSQYSVGISWTDNSNIESWYYLERYIPAWNQWSGPMLEPNTTSKLDSSIDCNEESAQFRIRAVVGNQANYSAVLTVPLLPCDQNLEADVSCELEVFNTGVEGDFVAPGPVAMSGNGSRIALNFNAGYLPGSNSYDMYNQLSVYDVATQTLVFEDTHAIWGDMDYSGDRFVFLSNIDYNGGDVDYHHDLIYWNNGTIQQLTNLYEDPEIGVPQISDDGSIVVFSATGILVGDSSPGRFIYIWDAVNGIRKLIPEARLGETETADLRISGDGTTVAFVHDGTLGGLGNLGESQIYLWDAVNGLRLMYPLNYDFSPAFFTFNINEDGSRISFTDNGDPLGLNPDENDEIFIWDATEGLKQITEDYSGYPNSLSVSLDGSGNRLLMLSALLLDIDQTETFEGGYFLYDDGYGFSQITFDFDSIWPFMGTAISADGSKIAILELVGWDGVSSPYLSLKLFIGDCTSANPLLAPINLIMSASAADTYNLAWVDMATNETAYHIERSYDGIDWTEVSQVPADSTSYTDTGLYCNITYFYRLRAYRASDNVYSDYSNIPSDYIPCLHIFAPTNLSFTAIGDTSMSINWTDMSLNEERYYVERSSDGSNWAVVAELPVNSVSHTDTGLACDTAYYYRVRAHRTIDGVYSDYSSPINALTNQCLILEAPSNIILADSEQTSLSITWTDNSVLESGYQIERSVDGQNWVFIAGLSADSISYTNIELSCSTAYQYRLRTLDYASNTYSPYGISEFLSTEPCPPLVASVLSSTGITETSIGLTWTVDTNATSFTLEYFDGTNWNNLAIFPATTTIYDHIGLSCGQNYQYRIITYRHTDTASLESAHLSVSTTACPAPNAPDAPIVLSSDLTVVNLQIPALPLGASTMYLERSSDSINWTNLGQVSTGNFSDLTVLCGTSYQYRLLAYSSNNIASLPSSIAPTFTLTCLTPSLVGTYHGGSWLIVSSDNPSVPINSFNFGSGGSQSIVGDWDGDGIDGIGVYHNGAFTLRNLATADSPDIQFNFGNVHGGWQAIAGDWDGDGIDSVGLYKNGEFILSNDNQLEAYRFTVAGVNGGWHAIAGDWNGDGLDGVAVYKNANWWLVDTVTSPSSQSLSYGPSQGGWQPLVSDWNDDGSDSIGLYKNGTWRLRTNNAYDTTEITFNFGQPGATPFVLDESSSSGTFVIP